MRERVKRRMACQSAVATPQPTSHHRAPAACSSKGQCATFVVLAVDPGSFTKEPSPKHMSPA